MESQCIIGLCTKGVLCIGELCTRGHHVSESNILTKGRRGCHCVSKELCTLGVMMYKRVND